MSLSANRQATCSKSIYLTNNRCIGRAEHRNQIIPKYFYLQRSALVWSAAQDQPSQICWAKKEIQLICWFTAVWNLLCVMPCLFFWDFSVSTVLPGLWSPPRPCNIGADPLAEQTSDCAKSWQSPLVSGATRTLRHSAVPGSPCRPDLRRAGGCCGTHTGRPLQRLESAKKAKVCLDLKMTVASSE